MAKNHKSAICTRGRTRTGKVLPPVVFETTASTNSATRAGYVKPDKYGNRCQEISPDCSERYIRTIQIYRLVQTIPNDHQVPVPVFFRKASGCGSRQKNLTTNQTTLALRVNHRF